MQESFQDPAAPPPQPLDAEQPTAGEITPERVRAEMERQRNKESSTLNNLILLVVSVWLFMSFTGAHYDATNIGLLVLVLFIHESGHYLGMKLFGYRDVKMFFIPMMGAAVSARTSNPSGAIRTTVSLLGPMPGIAIGAGLALYAGVTGSKWALQAAEMFVFLNVFNLLPLYPLDGAHVLEHTLFSRAPLLEAIFRAVTGATLLLLSLAVSLYVLAFFSVLLLLGVPAGYRRAKLARELRQLDPAGDHNPDFVPDRQLEYLIPKLSAKAPKGASTDQVLRTTAAHTASIWERACTRPPGIGATAGLLFVYFMGLFGGILIYVITLSVQDFPAQ